MKKMKTFKIIVLIMFIFSLFCTIDLGLNFLYNTELSLHDNSYGTCSILHAVFGIFGDSLWSFERFFTAFSSSVWITFALFIVNIVLYFKENV